MQIRLCVALAVLGILTVAGPTRSRACAPAPPPGQYVRIAGEEAIILWDAATRTETFIRRARFSSEAHDFGFLVPTPTQPALAEAPAALFQNLAQATRPRIEERSSSSVVPFSCCASPLLLSMKASAPARVPPVRVLDFQHVAGYDAVVLEADSATALGDWLKAHGYAFRPALVAWLTPYVAAHWKLTAFKITNQDAANTDSVGTAAVRMTFHSERPLFPYREPMDQRTGPDGQRLLRLYVVSDTRMEGRVGDSTPWPGKLVYADRPPDLTSQLAGALPAGATAPGAWLMKFEDESSPRPGSDELFFSPAATATPVLPPPDIRIVERSIPIPIELLLLIAWLLWRWRRRRAARSAPST